MNREADVPPAQSLARLTKAELTGAMRNRGDDDRAFRHDVFPSMLMATRPSVSR